MRLFKYQGCLTFTHWDVRTHLDVYMQFAFLQKAMITCSLIRLSMSLFGPLCYSHKHIYRYESINKPNDRIFGKQSRCCIIFGFMLRIKEFPPLLFRLWWICVTFTYTMPVRKVISTELILLVYLTWKYCLFWLNSLKNRKASLFWNISSEGPHKVTKAFKYCICASFKHDFSAK